MQTARKASITFLARLLFFDTLPNRQQQAVETAAAAGRPHPVQAWPDLEGDAVVEWQRYQAPFLGRLKAPWLQLVSRRLTRHVGIQQRGHPR
ncbi:hypothetical protein PI125_g20837 [Phytophthora idaei]|nr:hypothetical protein PI125_g20837 [Phytophthora idaei]